MLTETFDFTTTNGRAISAILNRPEGAAKAWALFAHCFTCGKDLPAANRISQALASRGVGVLRFDFEGVGIHHHDQIAPQIFSHDVIELVDAAKEMANRGMMPGLLIGHSLGGAAVIAAAEQLPDVVAIATIGAPFDVTHILKTLNQDPSRPSSPTPDAAYQATLGGRSIQVPEGFAQDLQKHDQASRLANLKRAILVLHAPLDETVSIDEASGIFQAAKHPKSFVSLDKANHLLTRRADAAYAGEMISSWASRYLGVEVEAAAHTPAPSADAETASGVADSTNDPQGPVMIDFTHGGKFQVKVDAGGKTFFADEPTKVGGLGSGPDPYQLVAAGLGACSVMTVKLYADNKGITLTKAHVAVCHSKNKNEQPQDRFDRVLTLEGDFTPEQHQRMVEIADKCPVHRTLENGSKVTTRTSGEAPSPSGPSHMEAMNQTVS